MKKTTIFLLSYFFILNSWILATGMEKPDDYNKHSTLQWDWAISSLENLTFT